jgi:hypothetical protein
MLVKIKVIILMYIFCEIYDIKRRFVDGYIAAIKFWSG